jgi:micrococcal nuclease
MPASFSQRAPYRGAFCVWGLALLLAALPAGAAPPCAADRIDEQTRVAYVVDGDTVELTDGRRLRLIGIDTPELGRDGARHEPYAVEARSRLRRLLAEGGHGIALRLDREHQDRYGRLLAHAFLGDGRSITAVLLAEGLGTQLTVPPNEWNLDCYREFEGRARAQRLGIWALPPYQPVRADALRPGARGFHLVTGRVERIGSSRRAVWLNLAGGLALRIDRADLPYFQDIRPEQLQGRTVTARGWIYSRDDALRMQIRHPAALEVAP